MFESILLPTHRERCRPEAKARWRSTVMLQASLLLLAAFTLPASAQSPASSALEQRVQFVATRSKKTRVQGGDFDDKTDRISFKLKFTNTDTKASFQDLQGEFYIFAESITMKKAYQVLGVEKFDLSLAPRASQEVTTAEVFTKFDTTDARFGAKYESWALVVRDSTGAVVMKKASLARWLGVAEKLKDLTPKRYYSADLKAIDISL